MCLSNIRELNNAQLGMSLLRSFIGEVATEGEHPTAHFLSPPASDFQHVLVLLKEALATEKGGHRAHFIPACL